LRPSRESGGGDYPPHHQPPGIRANHRSSLAAGEHSCAPLEAAEAAAEPASLPAPAMGNSLGCSASGERLVSAARDGDAIEARMLLELSPALARYSTFGGLNTPLHFAAAKGHLDVRANPSVFFRVPPLRFRVSSCCLRVDCHDAAGERR
jgi:hypothetical protein